MAIYQESDFLRELESEILGESVHETSFESNHESNHEADREAEQFFGSIANLARRAVQSPVLRKVASDAGRAALKSGMSALQGWLGEHECEGECEHSHEFAHEFSHELSHESAFETSYESAFEWNPETAYEVQVEAIMEHLGHQAAQAETEEEAFAFLAPLLPLAAKALGGLAAKALPIAAKGLAKVGAAALKKASPHLLRGVRGIAGNLLKSGKRPLLRTMPNIIRQTAQSVARQAAAGRPVTPQMAVRTLAQTAQRTLSNPQKLVQAYRRSRAFDRRIHRPVAPLRQPEPAPVGDFPIENGDIGFDTSDEFASCPACGR